MIFLISAMQHPALKELNVNNPQSIWGDSACYNYPALKELNVNNPQFYLGVGSQLSLPSSEGAEYEVHGKYLLSIGQIIVEYQRVISIFIKYDENKVNKNEILNDFVFANALAKQLRTSENE
jgi:hypothetical protein